MDVYLQASVVLNFVMFNPINAFWQYVLQDLEDVLRPIHI